MKQNGVGQFFLNEILKKKPKSFLEIGVFHGVTARNVCELLYKIHGNDFNYIGLDLFDKNGELLNIEEKNLRDLKPSTLFY